VVSSFAGGLGFVFYRVVERREMATMRSAPSLLLKLLQRSTAFQVARYQQPHQPFPSGQIAITTPLFASPPSQGLLRRFFAADGWQSSEQDAHHVKEYERAKMVDEGGANHSSFEEAREEVRKTRNSPPQGSSQQAVEKGSETTEAIGDLKKTAKQTTSEVSESAKGTSRKVEETVTGKTQEVKEDGESMVENVKETVQGLKDVGVEAAKAIKRDAEKVAEKVGIKSPN